MWKQDVALLSIYNVLLNILPPGPSRRFKRICELIQSMLLSNRDRHLGVAPQRRISADLCSDSSSSSYSSMDRVSPTPQDEVMLSQHSTSTASLIETIRSSKLLSPYKFISRQNINHWFFLSHRSVALNPPPFLSDINTTLFPLWTMSHVYRNKHELFTFWHKVTQQSEWV